MKRRDFLKTSLMLAAISTVAGKAVGLFNEAHAGAGAPAVAGVLGYKDVSPQAKNNKTCGTCKHYKANASAGAGAGECTLPAMKTAMKAKSKEAPPVFVKEAGYCNMWAKKV